MIWLILAALGIGILAIVFSSTFAVGLHEASDPNHSKAKNLTELEKKVVTRSDA